MGSWRKLRLATRQRRSERVSLNEMRGTRPGREKMREFCRYVPVLSLCQLLAAIGLMSGLAGP